MMKYLKYSFYFALYSVVLAVVLAGCAVLGIFLADLTGEATLKTQPPPPASALK